VARVQPSLAMPAAHIDRDAGLTGYAATDIRRMDRVKASDEQRVDNCKVPPDLRGPKPRPERCGDGTGEKR
jgi:hypothetical protein